MNGEGEKANHPSGDDFKKHIELAQLYVSSLERQLEDSRRYANKEANRANRLEEQVNVLAKATRNAARQCSNCPCDMACGRDGECTATIKAWSLKQARANEEGVRCECGVCQAP